MYDKVIKSVKNLMGDRDFVHIDFSLPESKDIIFSCFGGEEKCKELNPETYALICRQMDSQTTVNNLIPVVIQDYPDNSSIPFETDGLSLDTMNLNGTDSIFVSAYSVFSKEKTEMRHFIFVTDTLDRVIQVVENIKTNTTNLKTIEELSEKKEGEAYNIYLFSFELDEETNLAHMEILVKRDYLYQIKNCIALKTDLVTPYITDTRTGEAVIQYNMGPLFIYDPDFCWPIMYTSQEYAEEKRQELVLDIIGNIYLDNDYEFSSVKSNCVTMKLLASRGMSVFNNEINGKSEIQLCFKSTEDHRICFALPRSWCGVVPTVPLSTDDKAELLIQFTICALKKSTNQIVECEFSFCNSYDQTENNGNICHTPLLEMVWGYFLL